MGTSADEEQRRWPWGCLVRRKFHPSAVTAPTWCRLLDSGVPLQTAWPPYRHLDDDTRAPHTHTHNYSPHSPCSFTDCLPPTSVLSTSRSLVKVIYYTIIYIYSLYSIVLSLGVTVTLEPGVLPVAINSLQLVV